MYMVMEKTGERIKVFLSNFATHFQNNAIAYVC